MRVNSGHVLGRSSTATVSHAGANFVRRTSSSLSRHAPDRKSSLMENGGPPRRQSSALSHLSSAPVEGKQVSQVSIADAPHIRLDKKGLPLRVPVVLHCIGISGWRVLPPPPPPPPPGVRG